MKQLIGIMALAIGAVLVLNGPAWSDQKGKGKKDEMKETVEMAATAKVTIDEAIKTASKKVPGKVVEAELEKAPVTTRSEPSGCGLRTSV